MTKSDNARREDQLPRILVVYARQFWRGLLLLALALLLVLFPFGWLGEQWPAFGFWIDWLFATELAHAIGHGCIFFGLGLLLLWLFPWLRTRPPLYLGITLLAAIGQEGIQLSYKQRALVFDDLRDLLVDLLGSILAFLVVWFWQRRNDHAQSVCR
jgi:glycopeptide antibiotics resistance protein